jgi:thymidine phosphorylase
MDAMGVGLAAWRLGAGRAKQGEPVQAAAGVTWHVGLGEAVRAGQPLFTLHTDTPERIERAREALVGAVTTAPTAPQRRPLVLERVSG